MNSQLSKLEQSPTTAPKTWCTKSQSHFLQLRTTNQQVYWVVQVIPCVSKGRSHRDCRLEASYGYLVNLSQDIRNYQDWLWKAKEHEMITCFAVMENRLRFGDAPSSESLLSYCLPLQTRKAPSMASCMQGFHRCQWLPPILSVEMFNAPCHGTAIHLSVLNQAGIESSDSFASVTNAPPSGVWSTSQSFNHWILLRIPQTRLDLPDSLECRHQF